MPLISVPPEIQFSIFCHLPRFRDVTALASTCHSLHMFLELDPGILLRTVARQSLLAFDDALRAARASTFPVEWSGSHYDLDGKTYADPPTKAFCEDLSLAPPTINELRTVFRLASFVDSWQAVLGNIHEFESPLPVDASLHVLENFHRASYRFILLGYLFSGAYLEPLVGRERPHTTRAWSSHFADHDGVKDFPIYHTDDPVWRYAQLRNLFSGFIDWIMADGEKRGVVDRLCSIHFYGKDYDEEKGIGLRVIDGAGHGALREVLMILAMVDLYNVMRGRPDLEGTKVDEKVPPQTVTICPFGHFYPEEHSLLNPGSYTKIPPRITANPERYPYPPTTLLQMLFPHPRDEFRGRPELDFFHIAFKEHFCLRIRDTYYDEFNRHLLSWVGEGSGFFESITEEDIAEDDQGPYEIYLLECIP